MSRVNESAFGRYLASVMERDIDLLLMEEFHITEEFVSWFCARLGLSAVTPGGAWHSVPDVDGETDILLHVIADELRVGILIENKIVAPEQDKQDQRYHLRGARAREAGRFDKYITVMCAPQRYLDGLSSDNAYQHRVPYEAIADWFSRLDGRRAEWRKRIMLEAVEQSRRGYTMTVSATNTAFHTAYWEHLRRLHPRLHMARPTNKGGKSNWVIMKGYDFPKDVKLHHKLDQRSMELGFDRRTVEDILKAKSDWPSDVAIVQKGRTASLVVGVPPIDMTAGVASQVDALEEALRAAYRLMPYAGLFSAK